MSTYGYARNASTNPFEAEFETLLRSLQKVKRDARSVVDSNRKVEAEFERAETALANLLVLFEAVGVSSAKLMQVDDIPGRGHQYEDEDKFFHDPVSGRYFVISQDEDRDGITWLVIEDDTPESSILEEAYSLKAAIKFLEDYVAKTNR